MSSWEPPADMVEPDPNASCECCKGESAGELHTCPFREDIQGDYETQCNCCAACQHECAMDI